MFTFRLPKCGINHFKPKQYTPKPFLNVQTHDQAKQNNNNAYGVATIRSIRIGSKKQIIRIQMRVFQLQ